MKYLKLYEENLMDNILDKISSKETLTKWEQEYIKNYGTPKADEMEKDLLDKENTNREQSDKPFVFWNDVDEEDMDDFIKGFRIMPEFRHRAWDKLPPIVKEKFQEFLIQKGYL